MDCENSTLSKCGRVSCLCAAVFGIVVGGILLVTVGMKSCEKSEGSVLPATGEAIIEVTPFTFSSRSGDTPTRHPVNVPLNYPLAGVQPNTLISKRMTPLELPPIAEDISNTYTEDATFTYPFTDDTYLSIDIKTPIEELSLIYTPTGREQIRYKRRRAATALDTTTTADMSEYDYGTESYEHVTSQTHSTDVPLEAPEQLEESVIVGASTVAEHPADSQVMEWNRSDSSSMDKTLGIIGGIIGAVVGGVQELTALCEANNCCVRPGRNCPCGYAPCGGEQWHPGEQPESPPVMHYEDIVTRCFKLGCCVGPPSCKCGLPPCTPGAISDKSLEVRFPNAKTRLCELKGCCCGSPSCICGFERCWD